MRTNLASLRRILIAHALEHDALQFGRFTLNSHRKSPYFFNSGRLTDGRVLTLLGDVYAGTIVEKAPSCEVLFGPAYKGIPFATVASTVLWQRYGLNKDVSYNRKEPKDHGEGGALVGVRFEGKRVLIVDDVVTKGTSIDEAVAFIHTHGDEKTRIVGAVLLLDRQERGRGPLSAVQEIEKTHGFPVFSVLTRDDIINFIADQGGCNKPVFDKARQYVAKMERYRERYGV